MNSSTVYDVTIFGIDLAVKPVAFTIPIGDGWDIYWYGIIISIGFLAALLYAFKNAKKFDLNVDRMIDVVLVATPVAIIFARLYYIIFDNEPIDSFMDIISIHNGGLAIYGGVIGAFLAGAVMCKVRKVNMFAMFDLAALGFLLAQGIGRWGNFVNQEAYGTATGSDWWGMTSTRIQNETYSDALVHPCFFYESLWCILGFVLLHFFSKYRKFNGEIFLGYCAWYGFGRFFIEGLRTDQLLIGSLPVSRLVAALAFIAAVVLIGVFHSRAVRRSEDELAYAPIFGELSGGDDADDLLDESGEPDDAADSADPAPDDDLEDTRDELDSHGFGDSESIDDSTDTEDLKIDDADKDH